MNPSPDSWRRCSTCKKALPFKSRYWVCNVSTCNRKRTGLVFCSVPCWDAHVPVMNHRDAWALEKVSPSREEWMLELAATSGSNSSGDSRTAREASGSSRDLTRDAGEPAPAASRFKPAAILRRSPPGGPGGPGGADTGEARGAREAGSSTLPILERRIDPDTRSQLTSDEGDMSEKRDDGEDILVVASKLKQYIRARSGMSTSASVLEVLSDRLRELCDEAIEVARQEGRKTVMDRDFK